VTLCSRNDLIEDGSAGKRVAIYHCHKDQLWAVGEKENPPLLPDLVLVSLPDDEEEEDTNDNEDATMETLDGQTETLDGQRIDVKKSPYKKMSAFLSEMQKEGMVTVKELSKGVESITVMNVQNDRMQEYSRSAFAQQRKACKLERLEEEKEKKRAESKTIEVRELFAVSAKVAPFFKLFGKGKGAVMSSSDIRQFVTGYVKEKELVNPSNKKLINLDPLLTDVLFNKGQHQDTANWDGIMTRMLQTMNPCHEVTCPGEEPVIRKGKMDSVEVSIENRMGNKKVTVVKNLESFGIDTKAFAQSLQQAAASSTAVNPVPGKSTTGTLVIVQGAQLKHVKTILESYKIPLKYVKGLQAKK